MSILIIGLSLFLGVRSVSIVSFSWRDGVVARIGKSPWQGLHTLVILTGLIVCGTLIGGGHFWLIGVPVGSPWEWSAL